MSEPLEDALQDLDAGGERPVYLLAGEEFLVRKAAEKLLARLVPEGADLNLVTLDGTSPREVAAELATMPMFGGRKVVFLRDPDFLAPKKGRADALSRARDAWKANRRKEAARRVLALAARAGWGPGDLDPTAEGAPKSADWERELGVELAAVDVAFLQEVAAFCREEGLTAASGDDTQLQTWLEAGPPKGQVLVIAATQLEAKSQFVKLVKARGAWIELKVAEKGGAFDDRVAEFVAETLAPMSKKLDAAALKGLKERVGGNFRLLQSELVKLALYSRGATITGKDVELLVGHAREGEFFALSNAVKSRNLAEALRVIDEEVSRGSHPLMLLGALAGTVRRLLEAVEEIRVAGGGRPPKSYNDFQARYFHAIEARAKAEKRRPPHPFAAFKDMEAAAAFSRDALLRALVACAEVDLALKRGGDRLVLERLVWTLCGAAPAPRTQLHSLHQER